MIKHSFKSIIISILFVISFIIIYLINLNKENIFDKKLTTRCGYREFNATYLISEYQTRYNEQNINRTTNIKIATDKINGTVIYPGEIFSFNETVGNRTNDAGFKPATVYQAGKISEGIGGGICQVSTTLYNATMYANLMVIERKSHLFLPSYILGGRDATVADEYIDFKFKNTRKTPVKIVASANNGELEVKIYGIRQGEELDVDIQSINKDIIPYSIIYEKDDNMKLGEEIVIQRREKWV